MAPSGSSGGNTIPRCHASKKWFFTWNNYKPEDINRLIELFGSKVSKYIFQEEKGYNGTQHLQGCIELIFKGRPIELFGIKEIHWEKCANWEKAIKYCSKKETRNGNVFSNMPAPRVDTRILSFIPRPWQADLIATLSTPPDDRTVYWYVDLTGNQGKSLLCKYLNDTYEDVCVVTATKSADILTIASDFYKTYLIDIPRSTGDFCPFNAIEQLKNGLITDAKLKKEARVVSFAPPHVVIFSNHYPDRRKLSDDRWKIVEL